MRKKQEITVSVTIMLLIVNFYDTKYRLIVEELFLKIPIAKTEFHPEAFSSAPQYNRIWKNFLG